MILRKFCSVMSSAAAAQRSTILPSRQRQIFRVRRRTPLCGLSITLVETRQRERLGDNPKRFTVNISAKPSRKLADALGYSRNSYIQSAVSVEIRCAERDGATPRYVIDGRPKRAVTI